jgi:uncharacterized protein YcbK (DUF882 family)
MGDASLHFDWSEFACRCENPACSGKEAHVDRLLIVGLEELHERIAREINMSVRILVNSGCRCPEHDMEVRDKGSTEQHALWTAADIRVEKRAKFSYNPNSWGSHTPHLVAASAEACPVWHSSRGGIGVYSLWVHLDVRPGPCARWRG